jgi:hypothetical protein
MELRSQSTTGVREIENAKRSRGGDHSGRVSILESRRSSGSSLPVGGRINWSWELCHIRAVDGAYFADAAFADLVDAQNRMHRKVGTLYSFEFCLHFLFRRVDDDGRSLAEYKLFNFYEAEQGSVADFSCVNLIDLPLIRKNNLKNVTGSHIGAVLRCYAPRILHSAVVVVRNLGPALGV